MTMTKLTNNDYANMYGLPFLCQDNVGMDIGRMNGIKGNWIRIKYTEYNSGRWYEIKNCKPILRTLDQLSEEEIIHLGKYERFRVLEEIKLGLDVYHLIYQGLAIKYDKKEHGEYFG